VINNDVGDTISCQSCCIGKMSTLPTPLSTRQRATEVGQSLHSDICGPLGSPSLSGSNYIVIFKDEYSNFRFVYCLKSRSEAHDCLKKTIALIRAETEKCVREMVSDRGSEYTSNRTQELLLKHNISHKTSIPFKAAQDGFVERENRTAMDGVRSMLADKNVPPVFWGEAVHTFVYLLNRSINKNVESTPFELYYGRKPRVSHLKIFGCLAFVKTLIKKRSGYQPKLEPRAQRGMMVGYERDFSYRIFVPEEKKIIISRDVKFDEGKCLYEAQDTNSAVIEATLSPVCVEIEGDSNDEQEVQYEPGEDAQNNGDGPNRLVTRYNLRRREEESNLTSLEPSSLSEALRTPESEKWRAAADDEYNSLIKNKTWDLVKLPSGRQPITSRWVFKVKPQGDGTERYKCRLVARGFSQRFGYDYQETFSPVVKMETIRILLCIGHQLRFTTEQLDVETAFLHGELQEEIYMIQPEGYQQGGDEIVCRLNKSIYGLKQASRNWNHTFTNFLKRFNLRQLKSDTCVFVSGKFDTETRQGEILIVCVYVDDCLVMSNVAQLVNDCLDHLRGNFNIRVAELGNFIGLQCERDGEALLIHQQKYIDKLLVRFEMADAKDSELPMSTGVKFSRFGTSDVVSKQVSVDYRQAIGALLYLASGSRPDISFAVNVLSRFVNDPRLAHWNGVKQILRYVKYTRAACIRIRRSTVFELKGFSDADLAGCVDTRRSTTGVLILLTGAPIIWKSTRQSVVATSTCEAEYVAASTAAKEIVWVRSLIMELGFHLPLTELLIDNQGCIRVVNNDQTSSKTKHIDIRLHHVRELVGEQIVVKYTESGDQLADILTKAPSKKAFYHSLERVLVNVALREEANLATMQQVIKPSMGLLISLLLLSAGSSESLLSTKKSITYQVVYFLTSPCWDIKKFHPEAMFERATISAFRQETFDICDQNYKEVFMKAVQDFDNCDHSRSKRDLVDKIVDVSLYVVSNLIDTFNVKTKNPNRDQAVKEFYENFDLFKLHHKDAPEYLALASETSKHHSSEWQEMAGHMPGVVWAVGKAHSEILANAANLKAMAAKCRNGIVATKEHAEILKIPEFAAIDEKETQFLTATTDDYNEKVIFRFIVNKYEVDWRVVRVSCIVASSFLLTLAIAFRGRIKASVTRVFWREPAPEQEVPEHPAQLEEE